MEVSTDRALIMVAAYAYHAENIAKHPDLYLPETPAKFKAVGLMTVSQLEIDHYAEGDCRRREPLFTSPDRRFLLPSMIK